VTLPVARSAPARLPRPARRALVFATLTLLLTGTVLAWLFVRFREERDARSQREEAVQTATNGLETSLRIAASALGGVPAIVDRDGTVDLDAFQAYGQDVLRSGTSSGLAYEAVVAGPDRAAFEAATGLTIKDQAADGQLVPAAVRDRYCPIVSVVLGPTGKPGSEGLPPTVPHRPERSHSPRRSQGCRPASPRCRCSAPSMRPAPAPATANRSGS
jgi:hypothetical protein